MPIFELHRLGWNSFQQLCHTICREVLGQTVQSFLDSNDAGRDGAFAGTWSPTRGENYAGRFVIQCKYTANPNHRLKPSEITDELQKVEKLVSRGLCDVYVLMTNAGLSGIQSSHIETLLISAGVKQVLILGSTWINQQIQENTNLRMHVPRLYGLGDLSQILDDRAYDQARAVLESMREDLAKVVITASYRKAIESLNAHGFVLLIGEPAAGKTTIASMLAMSAADKWGSSVLKLNDPSKVEDRWNPNEPSQFFWVDDAFGIMQYEPSLAYAWSRIFPQVKAMLRRGAKIVLTSRDYIYARARHDLKAGTFPLFNERQVVIDVHDLSAQEREQILYNHLRLGAQPAEFRTKIKPHLPLVSAHARFVPEIARRLSDPAFTRNLYLTEYHLSEFVEKREQLLQEVLDGLGKDSQAALALIYIKKDHLKSPISLTAAEEDALHRLDSSLGECIDGLDALNGSLVVHQQIDGESVWRFKHPTIGDAFAASLARKPDLMGIFLAGTPVENLMKQVVCGDVPVQGAVRVPRALFGQVLARLAEFTESESDPARYMARWNAKWALHAFLTRRCAKEFLTLYMQANPGLIGQVSRPGLTLSAASEVNLAVRLHELELLPEGNRRAFVDTVSKYAAEGDDMLALGDEGIRGIFTDPEHAALLDRVRTELLPRLNKVRENEQGNYTGDRSADGHIEHLLEDLGILKEAFSDDVQAVSLIEEQIRQAKAWASENDHEIPSVAPRTLDTSAPVDQPQGNRSIFDDVDQ
jgi:hypothetical protein